MAAVLSWGEEDPAEIERFRAELRAAFGERPPRVLDPFAGGGAIPLEAMRLGCEAAAADLNPVAWFLLRCTLRFIRGRWRGNAGRCRGSRSRSARFLIIAGPNGADKTTFAMQYLPNESGCPAFRQRRPHRRGPEPVSSRSARGRAGRRIRRMPVGMSYACLGMPDAITNAVRQAAEHGEHVTPDQFNAGLAGIRAEISSLRADLTWRMLAVGGLIVAVLRLLDWSG